MDDRRLKLLEIKRAAGLATPEELGELRCAFRVVGNGLAVPLLELTSEEFDAKFGGEWTLPAGD
jgi:hypothetical protein